MGRNNKVDIHTAGGELGTIPLRERENLRTIDVDTSIVLLGWARNLRKVLEIDIDRRGKQH